jgi:hypothetical protein
MQITIECPPQARPLIDAILKMFPEARIIPPRIAGGLTFTEYLKSRKPSEIFYAEDLTPEKRAESDAEISEMVDQSHTSEVFKTSEVCRPENRGFNQ